MVTKIIAERINPMLSKYISKEQFGFLDNKQILNAIGTTKERLHSVKTKKLKFGDNELI